MIGHHGRCARRAATIAVDPTAARARLALAERPRLAAERLWR
jgi:hypothetical protein